MGRMKIRFDERRGDGPVATLMALVPAIAAGTALQYHTHTGAVLRVNGAIAGAFDREHTSVPLPPSEDATTLLLEVERRSLPTSGLPSGPGLRWRLMLLGAAPAPAREGELIAHVPAPSANGAGALTLLGHAHLDVAWLWTYDEARRKAVRTFATAVRLLEEHPEFVFIQSQPQLYRFIHDADPALFERVTTLVRAGRIDASVAALWVEPDCNVPCGESLLRQMLAAHSYMQTHFGCTPSIAWLPDSFGFPNTLPTLLAHAGIDYFATTKLQWNDTTRFPYPRFVWVGPDGSAVTSALLDSYDGDASTQRVAHARERDEPLVLGYGDGGGGVTDAMIARASELGMWSSARAWFQGIDRSALPRYQDELYLEYHRGTYTTHHDVKADNFALERALDYAEELAAWCSAVGAPRALTLDLRERLQAAWEILLRNQFHDVLPGTSVGAVYADVDAEYDRAEQLIGEVTSRARQTLPRQPVRERKLERCEPLERDGRYLLDNGLVSAHIAKDGTIRELRVNGGRNVATVGNRLAAYGDHPRKWEAWNIDKGYTRKAKRVKWSKTELRAGAIETTFLIGRSRIVQRIALFAAEPYIRVDLEVEWNERRTLLRSENWFAVAANSGRFGSPHGTIERAIEGETDAQRAKFEFPAQRFARFEDAGAGVAVLTTDSYGWSARALRKGGVSAGLSLLRGTLWPDPQADLGTHQFSYAYLPYEIASTGAIERAWRGYAYDPRVRLFTCADDAVAIVACKPAEDGDGIIVRVRECDGSARAVTLKSTARARSVTSVDALERPIELPVRMEGAEVHFDLGAFALRSFRVRYQ